MLHPEQVAARRIEQGGDSVPREQRRQLRAHERGLLEVRPGAGNRIAVAPEIGAEDLPEHAVAAPHRVAGACRGDPLGEPPHEPAAKQERHHEKLEMRGALRHLRSTD